MALMAQDQTEKQAFGLILVLEMLEKYVLWGLDLVDG